MGAADRDTTDRLRGVVELARPVNAVAASVLTLVGSFVAGATVADATPVVAAIVATVLATAAGNAVNDYFDREIDAHNAPDRPIPRGAVSPRGAVALATCCGLGTAAVVLLALPPLAIAIAVVNLLALVAYTRVFKGTPGAGNALVAYLVGSTFLFGGAAVGDVHAAAVLFVLAALATFDREVIKDVEDAEGDAAEGLRTLPLAIGNRRALAVGATALVVAVLASPLPYRWGTFGPAYLALVVPADVIMLYATYEAFDDPTAGQTHLKWGTFLAAAAFVVGRLFA